MPPRADPRALPRISCRCRRPRIPVHHRRSTAAVAAHLRPEDHRPPPLIPTPSTPSPATRDPRRTPPTSSLVARLRLVARTLTPARPLCVTSPLQRHAPPGFHDRQLASPQILPLVVVFASSSSNRPSRSYSSPCQIYHGATFPVRLFFSRNM